MSKHTPGPWTAVANEWDEVLPEKDRGQDWYILTEKEEAVALRISRAADARLIAAAPDLLAALKAVMEAAEKWSPAIDQGRAAIAKAEGVS